ncbi:LOW QUALITY PROTEIN: uncharacterized protein C1orf141 homolog [Rhynchonycteris naso]
MEFIHGSQNNGNTGSREKKNLWGASKVQLSVLWKKYLSFSLQVQNIEKSSKWPSKPHDKLMPGSYKNILQEVRSCKNYLLESKKAFIVTSTSMTASKSTKDKSYGIKKTKRYISFKSEPEPRKNDFEKLNLRPHSVPTNIKNQESKSKEPVEENLKSRSKISFIYLKDIDEAEYAKPLHPYSQHRQACRRTLGSAISSPIPNVQSKAYQEEKDTTSFTAQTEKKLNDSFDMVGDLEDYVNKRRKPPPQVNDIHTKENKSVRNDQGREHCSVGKRSLLPLCFEDELKKPNARIISISSTKTETSHTKQSDTNPIIFHDSGYVQTLLLTKYRLPLQPMENRNIYPYKKTNFALEKNCEILKSLINGQFITSSKPKRTMPIAQRKDIQEIPLEVGHRVLEDKVKKKTSMKTSQNISWNKFYYFSEPFPRLTKRFVDFLDKTEIQEVSAQTGKFERMLSTVKPTSKFIASPVKYCSKPLKNYLKVHTLHTVVPLEDLLHFLHEN